MTEKRDHRVSSGDGLDWRVTVKFESLAQAHGIFKALRARTAAAIAAKHVEVGVVAQRDADWLRIYASSYEALCRAQLVVAHALQQGGVRAEERAERLEPSNGEWLSVALPELPAYDAATLRAHDGPVWWGSETEPSRVQVHFELSSRRAARAFAAQLETSGYTVHHAGGYVFVFADDAADAQALAQTLKPLAPPGAQMFVEPSGGSTILI